ncbi:MAG: IreB family regulatory phosphoprotein [Oscillospiraceae bacterium]|nr:IreB family regulatory phosphoprotein [Oscillospiraceae bacterium]
MFDKTIIFSLENSLSDEIKQALSKVYEALKEKGYDPINQIVGYILSEDPTYITTHKNARSLIRKIDRDELLRLAVKSFLEPAQTSKK